MFLAFLNLRHKTFHAQLNMKKKKINCRLFVNVFLYEYTSHLLNIYYWFMAITFIMSMREVDKHKRSRRVA